MMHLIDPSNIVWFIIGLLVMALWRSMYDKQQHLKTLAQQQRPITLYNVYTDHGIYTRFVTEIETNRGDLPLFSEWNGDWVDIVGSYRQYRWYITTEFGRECAYRQPAYIAKPFRHDLE